MPVTTSCPDQATLEQLLLGKLSPADSEKWASHLEQCSRCATAVQAQGKPDTLVEAARETATLGDEPESPQVRDLIERLRGLPVPGQSATDRTLPPEGGPGAAGASRAGAPEMPTQVSLSGGSAADGTEEFYNFLAPAQEPDEIGRLGPYRILKVLGAGGMGVVFKAEDPHLKRPVALKTILPGLGASAAARQRFLREAQAAAGVKHDHVVGIYQVGEDRGAPFLAMEFLEGEPLDERLKREGRLSLAEVLRIGREMAEGLEAAHERGLVHRDIKPANVWLEGKKGRVKILDFGLARAAAEESHLTQSGAIVGTPAYMAPEQAQGRPAGPRSDLFSLGCVLYRMCTGEVPFRGLDTISTLMAVATENPRPPRAVQGDVPASLSALVMRLLAKKPEDRPASAREVADALLAIAADTPHALPSGKAAAPARPRRRWPLAVGAAAVLLGLALGAVYFWQTPDGGTVRIEVSDPDTRVVFDRDGPTVQGADRAHDVILRAGDHTLRVRRGELDFTTDSFSLRKGETVLLKVELLKDRLQLTRDGQVIGAKDLPPGAAAKKEGPRREGANPFDALRREDIDPYELKMAGGGDAGQTPEELVAILGDSRLSHFSYIRNVVLTRDGKSAITVGSDGMVLVWDTATRQAREVLLPERAIHPFALALNAGETVLAVSIGYEVALYEFGFWRKLGTLGGHKEPVARVALSPDGKLAAGISHAGELVVWNAASGGGVLKTVPGESREHGVAAFSPDGKVLAATGQSKDLSIKLWEVPAMKELPPLRAPKEHGSVSGLVFSPDGKTLFSGGGTIRRWDWAKGTGQDLVPQGVRGNLALHPGGKTLAGGDGANLYLWSAANGGLEETITGHLSTDVYGRQQVAFSGDGRWLACAHGNRCTLGLWNLADRADKQQGYRESLQGLAVTPDGGSLVTHSTEGNVRVWDVAGRKVRHQFATVRLTNGELGQTGIPMALTPDGKKLATLNPGDSVRFWDLATGRQGTVLDPAVGGARSLRISPDGRYAAAGADVLLWWDLKTLQSRSVNTLTREGMAFTPDGNMLIGSGAGHKFPFFNTATGELARELKCQGDLRTPHITADGKFLTGTPEPELWNLETGKLYLRMPPAHYMAVAPVGQRIAATYFNTLWVWDGASGRKDYKFGTGGPERPGVYLGPPAFSPDGKYVLISNGNGTIYVVRLDGPAAAPAPAAAAGANKGNS